MKLPKGYPLLEEWKEGQNAATGSFGRDRYVVHFFRTAAERNAEREARREAARKELLAARLEKRRAGAGVSHTWIVIDRDRAEHYIERKGASVETHTGPVAAVAAFLATDLDGRAPGSGRAPSARSERAEKEAAEHREFRKRVNAGLRERTKEFGEHGGVVRYLKRWLATDLEGRKP